MNFSSTLKENEVKDRFDEIAGDYDVWLAIDPDYGTHHQLLMNLLQNELKKSQGGTIHVLEMGCGTGYTSRRILETDHRVKLWALDASAEMIKETRKALIHYDRSRYTVVQDDVLDLGIVETVPSVVSVFMLHNIVPEMRCVAVRNMAAALRPGGLLIIGDKIAHDDIREHEQTMNRFWEMEAKLKDLGQKGRYDFWHQHNAEDERMKMTEKELVSHLQEAGLRDIFIGLRCGIGMYAVATARKPV